MSPDTPDISLDGINGLGRIQLDQIQRPHALAGIRSPRAPWICGESSPAARTWQPALVPDPATAPNLQQVRNGQTSGINFRRGQRVRFRTSTLLGRAGRDSSLGASSTESHRVQSLLGILRRWGARWNSSDGATIPSGKTALLGRSRTANPDSPLAVNTMQLASTAMWYPESLDHAVQGLFLQLREEAPRMDAALSEDLPDQIQRQPPASIVQRVWPPGPRRSGNHEGDAGGFGRNDQS